MHHVAIMNPKRKLIDKILSGKKTIESRWYKTKRAPRGTVHAGETIYFKDAGKPVTAQATISQVEYIELTDMTIVWSIVEQYGKAICLQDTNFLERWMDKRYCILMHLTNPRSVTPFTIDKRWFGTGAAWIYVDNISRIKTWV